MADDAAADAEAGPDALGEAAGAWPPPHAKARRPDRRASRARAAPCLINAGAEGLGDFSAFSPYDARRFWPGGKVHGLAYRACPKNSDGWDSVVRDLKTL